MQQTSPFAHPSGLGFPCLTIEVGHGLFSLFFRFLQRGFFLGASVGCSVRAILCEQLGLDEKYVLQRITTIFLDGKPVDDIDSAIVRDGGTLSLSAAMPGLVGAAMRRGGALASLRSSITVREDDASEHRGVGVIQLKLFNMVMQELGPQFLRKGITVKASELIDFFQGQQETFWNEVSSMALNGAPIGRRMMTDGTFVSSGDWIMLSLASPVPHDCP